MTLLIPEAPTEHALAEMVALWGQTQPVLKHPVAYRVGNTYDNPPAEEGYFHDLAELSEMMPLMVDHYLMVASSFEREKRLWYAEAYKLDKGWFTEVAVKDHLGWRNSMIFHRDGRALSLVESSAVLAAYCRAQDNYDFYDVTTDGNFASVSRP